MTTISSLIGENNDLVWVNGRRAFVTGADLVRQRWGIRARSMEGSYVIDSNDGLPYLNEIFTKQITKTRLREIFRDMSLATEGVIEVLDITPGRLDPRTRCITDMEVKCLIQGDEGEQEYANFRFSSDVYQIATPGNIVPVQPTETPVLATSFGYIKRDGGALWTDYAVLYAGPGISLTDGSHGIAIAATGLTSLNAVGFSALGGAVEIQGSGDVVVTQTGQVIDVFVDASSVSGVTSLNTLTDAVTISGGTGISVTPAGQDLAVSNDGVLSVNADGYSALTGAIEIQGSGDISVSQSGQIIDIDVDVDVGITSISVEGGAGATGTFDLVAGTNVLIEASAGGAVISSTALSDLDHGSLNASSLLDDDHPQYFRTDGTRVASGPFNMGDHGLTNVTSIDWVLDGITPAEGRQWWNDDDGTLNLGLKGGTSVMQIGQEMPYHCRNTSGALISDGTLVRIVGNTTDNPNIGVATGDVCVFGMVTSDIADNSYGYATTEGLVRGLDTLGIASGTELWRDNATGGWTATQPAAPNVSTKIGRVIRQHLSEGSIYVRPYDVPKLSYLSDVSVRGTTPTARQFISWDGTTWDSDTLSFDRIYDGLTEGSGRLADVDTGAVIFQNTGQNGALSLRQTSSTPVTVEPILDIVSQDSDSQQFAIKIIGDAGGSATNRYLSGHKIGATDNAVSLYADFPTLASGDYAFFGCRLVDIDSSDYGQARIEVGDSGGIVAQFNLDSAGEIYAFADGSIYFNADVNCTIDVVGFAKIESDQGTPAAPSLVFDTDAGTTPFTAVTESGRDFFLYQGSPTVTTPHYAELALQTTEGEPDTQFASLGTYADSAGADGYAKITMDTEDTTGDSGIYVIAAKSGYSPVFLNLELSASESTAELSADEIIYDGVIGQKASVTLSSSSATLTPNLSAGNHQNWSIGHDITLVSLSAGTPGSLWGVNYHIHIVFTGSYSIDNSAWPASFGWVDGSDGQLDGTNGDEFVLTIQQHGSDFAAGYVPLV